MVGYLASITLWMTFFPSHEETKKTSSLFIGLVTTLSGLFTRLYLVMRVRAASQLKRRRYLSVYRLLNIFPIDPPEAVRLLEQASQMEVDSLLVREKHPTGTHPNDRPNGHTNGPSNGYNNRSSPLHPLPTSIVTSYDHSRGGHKAGNITAARNPHGISVCIIIDVLNDFMLPSGAFSQAYGLEDTHRIRHAHPVIIEIYRYCHEHQIQVMLVSSAYRKGQFKKMPTLCTTEEGRQFSLPLQTSSASVGGASVGSPGAPRGGSSGSVWGGEHEGRSHSCQD